MIFDRGKSGFHRQRVVPGDCVCLRAMDGAAKLQRLLARGTAVGRPDARLRVELRALRGGAFVGEHRSGVQLIARGTDAGWAGHFCDDAVDCVAITPGICEALKEDWLGDGLPLTFRRLAGKGRKSGVKPAHSRQSWEMLWHFGQG